MWSSGRRTEPLCRFMTFLRVPCPATALWPSVYCSSLVLFDKDQHKPVSGPTHLNSLLMWVRGATVQPNGIRSGNSQPLIWHINECKALSFTRLSLCWTLLCEAHHSWMQPLRPPVKQKWLKLGHFFRSGAKNCCGTNVESEADHQQTVGELCLKMLLTIGVNIVC